MSTSLPIRLKIGLLINPYAGIGGPAGLKGSDGLDSLERETNRQLYGRAHERAMVFLTALSQGITSHRTSIDMSTGVDVSYVELFYSAGDMGATTVKSLLDKKKLTEEMGYKELNIDIASPSGADDTKKVVRALLDSEVDILVFVGGDGTARDVCDVVSDRDTGPHLVLGVPSGVKMHSGVFALDPQAAADIIYNILCGELVGTHFAEVRDIDEKLLRKGKVNSKYYGEMRIPTQHEYIQAVKQGGLEVEELVLLDMSHDLRERMADSDNTLYIFSPGTTCHFILQDLGFDSTLLGFDLLLNDQIIARDANAEVLLQTIVEHNGKVRLILTPIGGQGYLIGRGNQQLTSKILKTIGRENLWVVATKNKLENFSQRVLYMDSNDATLDKEWTGLIAVITGYHDEVLYRLGR